MSGVLAGGVLLAAGLAAAADGPAPATTAATTAPADPPLHVQRGMCFPETGPGEVRTFRAPGVVLWTDAPVDGPKIVARLQAVEAYLQARLPPAPPRPPSASRPARPARAPPKRRPVAVAIYHKAADYRALWRRVGACYRGAFAPVGTEGYSYRVFCATSYDDPGQFARRRSVVSHEFAHVWLYLNRGLRNDGNWLTEGLATAVQLHFFPDSGRRGDFARWMHAGKMLPLKRLMDLPRIEPKDYWQAGTLVELLTARHAEKLPAVVAAFNKGASAFAIVTEVLGTDFATLQKHWAEHVAAPARPTPRPGKAPPGKLKSAARRTPQAAAL